MAGSEIVIPSRRGRLLTQALGVVALGTLIGSVLQWSGILRTSPLGRWGASAGLPIVALAVLGVVVVVAITLVRDSWNHQVILGEEGLTVRDFKASYTIAYHDIASVKTIPRGGVVIAVRDREKWLAGLGIAAGIRRRTSDVIRGAYGGDILIGRRQLAIDGARFVQLIEHRLA